MYEHLVPSLVKRQRLSDYLVGIFPLVSTRKGCKKAIKKGWVTVDGSPGTTGQFITGGERITLMPPAPDHEKLPERALRIHYEDAYLAVVEKPPGLLVSGNKWMTLTNTLPANLRLGERADSLGHPQPAHRLDYPTSGLLVVGKTATCLTALGQLFQTGSIQKTYLAVVIGGNVPEAGIIDEPIDGKAAKSHYLRLAQVPSPRFGSLSLLRLRPLTGRRHQLRIHLSKLGHPILGDREYCPAALILQGKGLYLHAWQLNFKHPMTGKTLHLTAPPPKKFGNIFPNSDYFK